MFVFWSNWLKVLLDYLLKLLEFFDCSKFKKLIGLVYIGV